MDGRALGILFLLAVRPSRQSANLLDRVHNQKLADSVVGLRVPESPWPVVLAAHLPQDAVLSLRPPGQLIEVRVEMLARGEEDEMRRRPSKISGSTHPPQQKQADERRADGVDLDCSLPRPLARQTDRFLMRACPSCIV